MLQDWTISLFCYIKTDLYVKPEQTKLGRFTQLRQRCIHQLLCARLCRADHTSGVAGGLVWRTIHWNYTWNMPLRKQSITLIYFITAPFVGTATHSDIRPNMTQRNIWLGKNLHLIKSRWLRTKLLDVCLCGVEVTPAWRRVRLKNPVQINVTEAVTQNWLPSRCPDASPTSGVAWGLVNLYWQPHQSPA